MKKFLSMLALVAFLSVFAIGCTEEKKKDKDTVVKESIKDALKDKDVVKDTIKK